MQSTNYYLKSKISIDINQEMIEQLTTTRDIMKLEEETKRVKDDLNDKLKDASGMNNDFVKFQQGGAMCWYCCTYKSIWNILCNG